MQNVWLSQEEKMIRIEQRKGRPDPTRAKKLLLLFFLVCLFKGTGVFAIYDQDYEGYENWRGQGMWGSTWKCCKCGYENYDQIRSCGICGTAKK